MSGLTSG